MQWYCLGCKLAHEETRSNCKTCRDVNPAEQSISEESLRKSCWATLPA